MVCLALAFLSLRFLDAVDANESAELGRVIHGAVHDAELERPPLKVESQITALEDAGECLEGPDDSAVLVVLQHAWSLSEKDPKNFGSYQRDIVKSIGAIDRGCSLKAGYDGCTGRDYYLRYD